MAHARQFDPTRKCTITLKSHHGRFMCAEPSGHITCNRGHALEWETFTCIPMGNGKVALQSHHGMYLCAEHTGAAICNRPWTQAWEIHTVAQQGNKIGFLSCHGKWLSAQPNHSLQWNRNKLLEWEWFTVTVQVCWGYNPSMMFSQQLYETEVTEETPTKSNTD